MSPESQTGVKHSEIFLKQMEVGRTPLKKGLGQSLTNIKLSEGSLALSLVLLSMSYLSAVLMLISESVQNENADEMLM